MSSNNKKYDCEKRYNSFNSFLKEKFKTKVYKVTIDAGFSCPNRDGTLSNNGCIFCDDFGSFSCAHSNRLTISQQVNFGIDTLKKRFNAKKFLAYFQAYSNTYKPCSELKEIYDQAVSNKDIVGLSIGTRPDCIDEQKLDLIASYNTKYYTTIEYGLQTIHDKSLKLINRGHDYQCFLDSYKLTKQRNINVCVHVILGLPNETFEDMMKTADELNRLKVDGVKIHLLCVLKNTQLERIYNEHKYLPLNEDDYIKLVCNFLQRLDRNTTIHRLCGNGLKSILIAPKWLNHKFKTLNKIEKYLQLNNMFQGQYC